MNLWQQHGFEDVQVDFLVYSDARGHQGKGNLLPQRHCTSSDHDRGRLLFPEHTRDLSGEAVSLGREGC